MARPTPLPEREQIPIQAVPDPILSSPYEEPKEHWVYEKGTPSTNAGRRPAGFYAKAKTTGSAQLDLLADESREDLPLINKLRKDVARWRESGYRGASAVTQELLAWWGRSDKARRIFFCQQEAVETAIYLLELRIPGRSSRTGFKKFDVSDEDIQRLLKGEQPTWEELHYEGLTQFPTLVDHPNEADLLPLTRLGCKMATGSGKTVVMAMLVTWAFCNRGRNPGTRDFPGAILIVCPNITVRGRLQVLRTELAANYYDEFDLVPAKYRHHLREGKVLVTNWHALAPKSAHVEGDTSYRVVDKGEETDDAFALDRLGELADRMPILVMNDEGHHCWRPKAKEEAEAGTENEKGLSTEDKEERKLEEEEARVWLAGLDRINNSGLTGKGKQGILACIDLSATPFYLGASGHPEGSPFPWLVSDFGLVDAIESGIVKIPRLPVLDDTNSKDDAGRPDPKYFRLWKHINEAIPKAKKRPNGRPKPEPVYEEAESALVTLAGQWKQRFDDDQKRAPTQQAIPPVMIVVCDNTEIAEVFFRNISGEQQVEVVRPDGKTEKRTVFGPSEVLPELANDETCRRTIQIDSRILEKLDVAVGSSKDKAALALRRVIETVGKRGEPGEHVRCVVSVSMLTEGWDASNVTHILGVRAFGSQLLCEQVVGRGLRRRSYTLDSETGKFAPEYVDVYGIPFTLIPFKGRPKDSKVDDGVTYHVFADPEKAEHEIRFPNVESYAYALRQEGIVCDVEALEGFIVNEEPNTVYLTAARGYDDDSTVRDHKEYTPQDRSAYYESQHLQTILFQVAQRVVDRLVAGQQTEDGEKAVGALISRHRLFPEVLWYVRKYVGRKVTFGVRPDGTPVDPRELGLEKYSRLLVERVADGILPAAAADEAPLLPVLNSFRPNLTSADAEYTTRRPVVPVVKSHLNASMWQGTWEESAIAALEKSPLVTCFLPSPARVGLRIPYEYADAPHHYEPDFIVKLKDGAFLLLEIKGGKGEIHAPDLVLAKNAAAKKWVAAVNNHKGYGRWLFSICRDLASLPGILEAALHGKEILEEEAETAPVGSPSFRLIQNPMPLERWKTCVPVVPLKLAASPFSAEEQSEAPFADWTEDWAEVPKGVSVAPGMFVAQVLGKSMEPRIADGAWCLFRPVPAGSRRGRIVLAAAAGISDTDVAGSFTVKRYESEYVHDGEGNLQHTRITLRPENPAFEPIVLLPDEEDDVRVIAEFVQVLGTGPEGA
jgi:type III restriction enzyme